MKFVKQFENKKVLVLGLAKSGESAARLLDRLGAIVTVNDGKPFEENPAAQSLLEEGIKVVTGGHPLELLDEDFAVMVKNPGIPYSNPMVEKALEKGIPCWISMEERMACGVGACLACVCKSKDVDSHSHVHNKRVCKDGPVFLSTEVEL